MKNMSNFYLCNKCSAIVERDSNASTIKSICSEYGNKPSVLRKIKSDYHLAVLLRKRFLKNIFELKTFTKKEKNLMYTAWQQGAMVVFNRINRKP